MSLYDKISHFLSIPCPFACAFVGTDPKLITDSSSTSASTFRPLTTHSGDKSQSMFPLSAAGYTLKFFTSIHAIDNDWEAATHPKNRFLQRDYLQTLEDYPPADMKFAYWTFYLKGQPVGVAIGQIVRFKVTDNIKTDNTEERPSLVSSMKNKLTQWVAGSVGFNLLIVGSTLLTGEHAYYFNENCKESLHLLLIQEALEVGRKELQKENVTIDGNMIKDFSARQQPICKNQLVEQNSYTEFEFQPTMITDLRPEWNNFDDYLSAMSSKYRVRARRAHKMGNELEKRSLSAIDIRESNAAIYQLYQNVVDAADVNMAQLHSNYFLGLKESLGDRFQLIGWYLNDKLIGFHTLINNYHELEAHFLGLDHNFNRSHQLYLNMLYAMTEYGIEHNYQQVAFARTALEIKSSVGAEPHRMLCYIRHNKGLPNRFLKSAVSYFEPNAEWTQRHPFK